jgi:hypothetical protein
MARLVTIVVGLILLGSVATAFAECAWVLWEQSQITSKGRTTINYHVVSARAAEPDCRANAASSVSDKAKMLSYDAKHVQTTADSVTWLATGGILAWRYTCLPDTIDPRGSKGER